MAGVTTTNQRNMEVFGNISLLCLTCFLALREKERAVCTVCFYHLLVSA